MRACTRCSSAIRETDRSNRGKVSRPLLTCRALWHTNVRAVFDAAAHRDSNGTATGGVAMSNSVRNYVWLVVGALVCIAGVLAVRFAPSVLRLVRAGVIVRRPNPAPLTKAADRQLRNIAPLATVTVSSADTARGQIGRAHV